MIRNLENFTPIIPEELKPYFFVDATNNKKYFKKLLCFGILKMMDYSDLSGIIFYFFELFFLT
ncbi:hypothetical protein A2230_02495 [candidate division WOR-1 bacterium RIFOXYA2_FULL_36_21]|uniref:Uncharacterized protein n=1 Tax=candidate division WOR-1 bacterium RIFOXYB2_FULL_36_35 TaxID=1802578 RepID=A0A1F4S720_UNCSA|nr:MAG: hypothetical protein A2230_02495 [candidate division WOR-1 bacterium RIFOXYA2_FULL_36_21]OGC16177.1 MAG: hypothetical protein A2290_02855 [candidate division WOR-1 bacterium RIFOXYB2_FULL_36_35]OGC16908.1 MAG: hypothetical protein A2282_00645 [candidate division WOR-1 bacterium RIFOXYA12_FULL_36_13]